MGRLDGPWFSVAFELGFHVKRSSPENASKSSPLPSQFGSVEVGESWIVEVFSAGVHENFWFRIRILGIFSFDSVGSLQIADFQKFSPYGVKP
ncbi:hypothetical protein VDG1235_2123 [Verrucomicrobiia bacterium DG1235]|nr:hypothetical protein VDG1235_2123 [Verrucomicrobiae bacterium DG1235]